MTSTPHPLADIRIASPCQVSWDAMKGDERVRFCGQCSRHVYNLSAMSADEAADLVEHHEGRLCVRFYRRADGTVLTQDCPVGLRWVRRRVMAVAAAIVALLGFGFWRWSRREVPLPPEQVMQGRVPALRPTQGEVFMGDVASRPAPR